MEEDLYLILGLDSGVKAQAAEIRKAYRSRALLCHPDKRPDDPIAASEFARLQRAYEVLSDEKARKAYDDLLMVKKARLEKESQHSSKRQKMMQDLRERENAYELQKQQKVAEDAAAKRLQEEMARIRANRARKLREAGLIPNSVADGPLNNVTATTEELDKTLKVSWTCLGGGDGGYTAEKLKEIFEEFGGVENVVMKRKKGVALVVMASTPAAVRATKRLCGNLSNPLLVMPVRPLQDANDSPSPSPIETEEAKAPPVAGPSRGARYQSYENSVIEKMQRAAERARLLKEIQTEAGNSDAS